MKKRSVLAVVAAASLWGLMGLFVRRCTAAGLGSLETTQLRITVGLLLVGLYLALFHREKLRIRWRDLWCFLGTGVVSLLLFSYCYFRTMSMVSLAVAGVLLYTAPVFVMLMSILLFRERMTLPKLLALVMAVAGCTLVSGVGSGESMQLPGLLLGLGAGFFYALYSIFSRYAIQRGYDSWTITFYTFLFCAAGCALVCDWQVIGTAVSSDRGLWPWVLAMGLTTGFGAYLLYTWGLQRIESSRASILASVEPVVAALVGVFVFGESISPAGVAGIALVLGAIVVLSLPKTVNNP